MPLFKSIFRRKRKDQNQNEPTQIQDVSKDQEIEEELSVLGIGDDKNIKRADIEAKEVVTKAARDDIRKIKILGRGRCPECQGRTENFLFTVVCPSCGWYRRVIPRSGHSTVFLGTGEKITCDMTFNGGQDEILCITNGVVTSQLNRASVERIDHVWKEKELDQARKDMYIIRGGICSWCEKDMTEVVEKVLYEDYVAFGTLQERYIFCSEKCMKTFRLQYPSRIHRNCYETNCRDCNLCVKRFDVQSYERHIIK